jgi:hypothetical protein
MAAPVSAATPTINEIAKLLGSDSAELDGFGASVAVDGDTAVIGAAGDDEGRGAAYVFARNGGAWVEQQKLRASDPVSGALFGTDVAVDGDTIMIGAPGDDDTGVQSGSVYVFVHSGDTWAEQPKLRASDAAQGELFGISIALDGDTAVFGATASGFSGDFGSAYVFARDGEAWTEQQKVTPSGTALADFFGRDVALDGDTVVIGALGDDESRGAAYVFVRDAGAWVEQRKLTPGDAAADDVFGSSVDVEGDIAIIGAAGDDGIADSLGSAYVFVRSAGIWTQQQKLTASDGATFGLLFGNSVALAGNRAMVAAQPNHFFDRVGAVYTFVRSGTTWTEELKLLASDIPATSLDGGGFGEARVNGSGIAISQGTVIVGAFRLDLTDPTRVDAGAAYVFGLPTVDDAGPLVSNLIASPNPAAINTPIAIAATIDDTNTGGSDIASAVYSVDGEAAVAMSASDGNFDSPTESLTASIADGLPVGIHEICVSGTDSPGNTGPATCMLLAVYDPSGGFVTGGGSILSPAGAYPADPDLTGPANFGFVSSYRKGAAVPEGNAQFAFHAGDLSFHSGTFEWLVVAGGKAQLKGVGTINGQGNYGFLIFATDAESTAATGDLDSFRIQIWNRNNGDAVVYDNGAEQPLSGGNIMVHIGGKKQ